LTTTASKDRAHSTLVCGTPTLSRALHAQFCSWGRLAEGWCAESQDEEVRRTLRNSAPLNCKRHSRTSSSDIFPFTDGVQRDPDTGVTDGLLTHATKPEHRPKVFYTNSSYEYWGRAASLIHTTADGTRDAALAADTRIYLLSAGQHGVAAFPPARTIGQQLNNPLDYRWVMRSLLVSMQRWVADGTPPPPSPYPRVADGTLVEPGKLSFPKIPGVNVPTVPHRAYRADYGPDFASRGVVSQEPPAIGRAFPILVPQVDVDGNELAGVRVPELSVPVATYTGWNLFNERSGPTDVVSSMQGSFIAFAPTKIERERAGDPRRSVEERYEGRTPFLRLIAQAAAQLVEQGYLRQPDVTRIVDQAGTRWDFVAGRAGSR
jgi:Alpha/beta hydrolase domain